MALSHAILVSLLDRPQSGYDLAKRFDRTVGYFWKASHQQIYLELHRLEGAGSVYAETVAQNPRPNRIVYAITPQGRTILERWVEEPTGPPNFKEELLVKLFALGSVDTRALHREVGRRLAFHRERLAHFGAVMAEHYPEAGALSLRKRGRYLGLRLGIVSEEATIQWCEEALALLARPRGPARKS